MGNKGILIFILGFLLAGYFSSPVLAAGPKYAMWERFGGSGNGTPLMAEAGLGWYFHWWWTGNKIPGVQYMGMVGNGSTDVPGATGEVPETPASPACSLKKDYILSHQALYPDYTRWTVGNEIGWDDSRTADQYADDFVKWRTCLKGINSTFQVGSGAIISLNHKLPRNWSQGCTTTPAVDGGTAYFTAYINRLKNVYQLSPDFIVNHAYTFCRPQAVTVANFISEIREQRQLMKNLGLANKDLIINEWSDMLMPVPNYLFDTVSYLMTAVDPLIGNPDDEYRLVQKWAWFIFIPTPDAPQWAHAWLSDTNGQFTPLGLVYKNLIPPRLPFSIIDFRRLLNNGPDIFTYNLLVRQYGL